MVSEQVRHNPACTVTKDGYNLETLDLRRGIVLFCVGKTKAQISFAVTAMLICVFAFAYANCWFSHDVTHTYIIWATYDLLDFQALNKNNNE